MKHAALYALGAALMAACAGSPEPAEAQSFSAQGKSLRQVYEHLHKNPELSFQEKNSSAILAAEMKRLGFTVTTNVGDAWVKARAMKEFGKIEDGVGGYGVVAVLKNGEGPTLMIRADMDGLPVVEKTGVPYASTQRDIAWSGEENGVMHACGHDLQPAEEIGLGAMSMIEDGLFTRFPRPDYVIGLHDSAESPAGSLAYGSGYVMANVDSVDITVKGVGGHGAYPQTAKDPVVVAARIVTTLQTLISRELDPIEAGVVTVGAFNAGFKHNIIPDEAKLQLTVRSFADATREKLLRGIERIVKAEAMAAGLEGDLAPTVSFKEDYTPSLYNNPDLVKRLEPILRGVAGAAGLSQVTPTMGGEDFARYGREEPRIPIMMFWLGAVPHDKHAAAQQPGAVPLPSLHSPTFAPDPDPTIESGVKAMTASALELLK